MLHCPTSVALNALTRLTAAPPTASPLSGLARADAEDELADWLENQGATDGYHLAAGLLDAGLTPATLETGAGRLGARRPAGGPGLARNPAHGPAAGPGRAGGRRAASARW